MDLDWIVNPLFKKWIWIWILNHIFVLDLDWIDNQKKIGLSKSLLTCLNIVILVDFVSCHEYVTYIAKTKVLNPLISCHLVGEFDSD